MKLAVIARRRDPISLRVYRENVSRELTALGVTVTPLPEAGPVPPGADLIWDPGLGTQCPPRILKRAAAPVVGTVHGLGGISMRPYDCAGAWKPLGLMIARGLRVRYDWRWFRRRVSAVIAVSRFGADEISRVLRLPRSLIHTIHHGVDHEIFTPHGETPDMPSPYLFLAAQYQPVKNIDRLIAAYARLPAATRPDLVPLLPGFRHRPAGVKGLRVLVDPVAPRELAGYYRGALGFVLPSLHETFCMPMLEAMACGCPVIGSTGTGMSEVAGDAALLVNPRSVAEIAAGLRRLAEDADLRQSLRERGLARAKLFTWRRSAQRHLDVFRQVLKGKP